MVELLWRHIARARAAPNARRGVPYRAPHNNAPGVSLIAGSVTHSGSDPGCLELAPNARVSRAEGPLGSREGLKAVAPGPQWVCEFA